MQEVAIHPIEENSLSRRRALVVYNPVAGGKSPLLNISLTNMEKLGLEIDLRETKEPGEGENIVREAVQQNTYDTVVAAGGDGTINEVANGLLGTVLPMGIIPLGTVNLLALEIGLGMDPDLIARSIAFGPVRRVNVGWVNGRTFLLMVGAGFDGRVVAQVTPGLKKFLGRGAYGVMAMKELLLHSPARLAVEVDGCQYEAAWVIVSKGCYYGARFILAPEAGLISSGFSVSLVSSRTRWGLFCALLALLRDKKAGRDWIQVASANRITINGREGEAAQADGDFLGNLPLTITSAPYGLKLIMPHTGTARVY